MNATEDMRSDAAADRLLEDSWRTRSRRLPARELISELAAAVLFLAAAGALLAVPGATAGFDWHVAALLVGCYVAVAHVEFPVGAGNVVPTQLVLVPMLVLLPPATVPLAVAAGLLLTKGLACARRRASLDHLLFAVPDGWHAVGPAAFLVFADAYDLGLGQVPALAVALICSCVFDAVSALLREAAARGVAAVVQLQVLALVWVVDACLAPVGLLAARAAEHEPAAIAAILPLGALLWLLGRDRRKRIEQAQQRLELAIRERGRLQAAVRLMGDAFAATLNLDALIETLLRGSIEALDADAGLLRIGERSSAVESGAANVDRVLRDAAQMVTGGTEPRQLEHSAGWVLALPLDLGSICITRPRPFEADEVSLLGELVAKAQAAATDILARAALRQEAEQDALTGLGNRRKLALDAATWAAEPHVARLLMLFDLDGFKAYNDTFGHLAGDALLTRLGAKLSATIAPFGDAYRLGGDEFCAVVEIDPDRVEELITITSQALAETGEGFAIGASYGVVVLPHEADSLDHALQLADQRMYAHKHVRSSGAREQARDVLLRTLQAKQPTLQEHAATVAELAVAVARRFGMTSEEIDEVARAAELHDVGKIGIPDAILDKPGPLDDDEWTFMRQHTILGERILNAAPALRPVARLVRASHERWDGTGYPDNLKGAEIPLGARIVAICDAYEAMTGLRAYRDAVSHELACRELLAMAGTQFDPEVVAAFIAHVGEHDHPTNADDHVDAQMVAVADRVRTLLNR